MRETKKDIIERLRNDILLSQGFKPAQADQSRISGLEAVEQSFPNGVFPTGMLHEFVSDNNEDSAASSGFITGLLSSLMKNKAACLWVSAGRTIFPPALKSFGIEPHYIIFADLKQDLDVLWATEEALKCEVLAAVVSEIKEINFAQSRRLQLVAEKSKVTGIILRNQPKRLSTTACVSRWKITPAPGILTDMPGVGFPHWRVELLKVKNGVPGIWHLLWHNNGFKQVSPQISINTHEKRKVG